MDGGILKDGQQKMATSGRRANAGKTVEDDCPPDGGSLSVLTGEEYCAAAMAVATSGSGQ